MKWHDARPLAPLPLRRLLPPDVRASRRINAGRPSLQLRLAPQAGMGIDVAPRKRRRRAAVVAPPAAAPRNAITEAPANNVTTGDAKTGRRCAAMGTCGDLTDVSFLSPTLPAGCTPGGPSFGTTMTNPTAIPTIH